MLAYEGTWMVTILSAEAHWPQRLVIGGDDPQTMPGNPGTQRVIGGVRWTLAFEHHDGGGWRPNVRAVPGEMQQRGPTISQIVRSKDRDWPGDRAPNDLVVKLDAPLFSLRAETPLLRNVPGGDAFLGIGVRNVAARTLGHDFALTVSAAGRRLLADCGVELLDGQSSVGDRTVAQEWYDGDAVAVPPLPVGARTMIYLPVRLRPGRSDLPAVELELRAVDEHGVGAIITRTHGVEQFGQEPAPVAPLAGPARTAGRAGVVSSEYPGQARGGAR